MLALFTSSLSWYFVRYLIPPIFQHSYTKTLHYKQSEEHLKRVEKKRKSVQEKKKEEKRKIKTEYATAERVTVVEKDFQSEQFSKEKI